MPRFFTFFATEFINAFIQYKTMKGTTLALLLAATTLMVGCGTRHETKTKAPTRVTTEVIGAAGDEIGQTYVGIVEEREATAVSFTGMGVVRRVLVSEGQAVGRGQLLAEMDDTQARNTLAAAEAAAMQADDALQRMTMLHDAGSLPEQQWVEVQSKVAQARAQLEAARKNLADCRLTAPVSGVVGTRSVKAGETALPSQAVVTLLDVSSVKVKVAIPEAEINAIEPNTPSTIEVAAAAKEVPGGRIEKGVQADAMTHTYDIRIHVPNPDRRLLPGMVANVRFATDREVQAHPLLPVTSILKKSDGELFVWTIGNDSTAHRQTIVTGAMRGNLIAVTSGISAGQRIVTEGYQKLSEGTKVIY